MITSDPAASQATFFFSTEEMLPTRQEWAKAMLEGLLPRRFDKLQKQRWLKNKEAISAFALLQHIFNLFSLVMPAWLQALGRPCPVLRGPAGALRL